MKIGLVGVGRWGTTVAGKFLDQGHQIACHSRASGEAIEGFGELVPWKTMKGKVDAVVAMATPEVTEDVAFWAVDNKIPVLVTKPLFGGEDILSKWNNSIFMVDYVRLYSPHFQRLKALVAKKRSLGLAVKSVDVLFYSRGPVRNFPALYDYGPHALAMIFDVMNTALLDHVTARKTVLSPGRELYDVTTGIAGAAVRMVVGNGITPEAVRQTQILVRFVDDTWGSFREIPSEGAWPCGLFETSDGVAETDMADPLGLLVQKFCKAVEAGEDGADTDLELSSDIEYALGLIKRVAGS